MIITDTKKSDYPGYGADEDELFSVENYAEFHYWCFFWSVYLDAVSCTPYNGGWKVVLSSPPERGIKQVGQPYQDVEMLVWWDDANHCLNAECLLDSNAEIMLKFRGGNLA